MSEETKDKQKLIEEKGEEEEEEEGSSMKFVPYDELFKGDGKTGDHPLVKEWRDLTPVSLPENTVISSQNIRLRWKQFWMAYQCAIWCFITIAYGCMALYILIGPSNTILKNKEVLFPHSSSCDELNQTVATLASSVATLASRIEKLETVQGCLKTFDLRQDSSPIYLTKLKSCLGLPSDVLQ